MKSTIVPVDTETGEIAVGVTLQDEDDRRRAKEYWERHNAKKLRRANHGPLGKFFLSTCRGNQFDGLSPQDTARLIYIASFMGYDGVLMLNEHRSMKIEDLEQVLNLSKSTFLRLWNKVKGRFVFENEDGTLVVKDCFFRGKQKTVKERLTKVFIQQIQALYRNTPVSKHRYLGYIFQLLSYINVQYNVLCYNPLEADLGQVSLMTIKDFCRIIGYNESQMSRLTKVYSDIVFQCNGELRRFCAFVDCGRQTDDRFVIVNPRVFYAGDCFERVEVLGLFFK